MYGIAPSAFGSILPDSRLVQGLEHDVSEVVVTPEADSSPWLPSAVTRRRDEVPGKARSTRGTSGSRVYRVSRGIAARSQVGTKRRCKATSEKARNPGSWSGLPFHRTAPSSKRPTWPSDGFGMFNVRCDLAHRLILRNMVETPARPPGTLRGVARKLIRLVTQPDDAL